jgi:hypothetical protein
MYVDTIISIYLLYPNPENNHLLGKSEASTIYSGGTGLGRQTRQDIHLHLPAGLGSCEQVLLRSALSEIQSRKAEGHLV